MLIIGVSTHASAPPANADIPHNFNFSDIVILFIDMFLFAKAQRYVKKYQRINDSSEFRLYYGKSSAKIIYKFSAIGSKGSEQVN
jgi:hypothetical protein